MNRGRTWLCAILGFCAIVPSPVRPQNPNLNIVFQWGQLEFDYLSHSDREHDISTGIFTPGVIAPIDVDVHYSENNGNNLVFVTIPRFVSGIPATLGTVTNKNLNGNPIIKPYPSWTWHQRSEDCHRDRIVSVFRVKIDECGRLWVLDTGKIGDNQICPPQILAFNLKTNELVHRHELPPTVLSSLSLLVTPIVDVRDQVSGCKDTFVYIADVLGFAIIVHDVAQSLSWKVQDKTMYPYPSYGTYNIAGESFELMDGVLGLALSPHRPGEDRVLFYHAMSSPTENWVYTSHLRNHSMFHEHPTAPHIFHTFSKGRSSQSAAEAVDKNGVMFFGLIKDLQIACWNIKTEYGPKHFDIVASNPVTLQFPSGIKVIKNRKGQQELWVMTMKFQKVVNESLNPKEPNFRIQAGNVDDLIFGTKCKGKHQQQHQQNQSATGGYGFYG